MGAAFAGPGSSGLLVEGVAVAAAAEASTAGGFGPAHKIQYIVSTCSRLIAAKARKEQGLDGPESAPVCAQV